MKIYRLALIAVIGLMSVDLHAQSFDNLENGRGDNSFLENGLEVYIRRTQVDAKFTPSYGGTTFNIKYRGEDYVKGGRRWHFENPTLGDMLFVVGRLLKGGDTNIGKNGEEQAFGSGFFGWHQVYWNAVAKDRLLVSPGISFGDYIFSTRRAGGVTLEPSGYFFHVGPSLMVTQILGDKFWLNVYSRYDLTGRASGAPANDGTTTGKYKRPHFLGLGTSIQHAGTRLCGGINYTQMIDRGANNDSAKRIDISFGFMF
jgi:hypothetical protein